MAASVGTALSCARSLSQRDRARGWCSCAALIRRPDRKDCHPARVEVKWPSRGKERGGGHGMSTRYLGLGARALAVLAVSASLAVGACSGGGGSSGATSPPPTTVPPPPPP